MKTLAILTALAAFGGAPLWAQDNPPGPVVYPPRTQVPIPAGTNAADSPAPDTNQTVVPAAPTDAPAVLSEPPAAAPGVPAGSPFPSSSPVTGVPATPAGQPATGPLPALAATGGANAKPDDIDDIRPPFFYLKPLTWLWVLLGVLSAAALAVLLWFWLAPLRARRARTAYELALEKLERARALIGREDAEPYAVLVSETVRTYLSQRFHAPSTRRTTEEFLRQMQADPATPLAAHRDLLRGFLESCDLVKFAHYQPGREELEEVQQRAVSFVTATRPVEGAAA